MIKVHNSMDALSFQMVKGCGKITCWFDTDRMWYDTVSVALV